MDNQPELMEAITSAAVERDGRLTLACVKAFELARDRDVPLAKIAGICDAVHIKIVHCQLGCFR
jgi:hypothetical protein